MKWSRTHELARERILEKLAEQTRPFGDMSESAQKVRRALPFLEWCETYMPHYIRVPFAPAHGRMADAAGEPGMPTFVCAFRGFGKSVLLSLARPLWRTVRREVPYWLYGARVQGLAAQNMDCVRLELEHNERIACDYPGLRIDGEETDWVVDLGRARDGTSGRWALTSCKFEAFGIGQSPRGRRHLQHRPYEVVGDDLEDAELARNPKREDNLWGWLMDEVLPALEPDVWVFTVVGTMFGPDCLLERARKKAEETDAQGRPLMRFFRQPALNDRGHSVWPERFSDASLDRIRRLQGLRYWLRNFELRADDPDKPFQPVWIDRHRYDEAKLRRDRLTVVCYLDPALSEAPTGCPRALVAVGADTQTGERYVLDAWISRGSPADMVEHIYQFDERWQPRVTEIESNGGFALIRPLLREVARSRGREVPVRYEAQTTNKDDRIQRLVPAMENGRWRFPQSPNAGVQTLEAMLLSYPDGFKDGPDALASADRLLPNAWRPAPEGPGIESRGRRRNLAGVL